MYRELLLPRNRFCCVETKKEIVMLQLDLEKAYDHVNWSFLCQVMHRMGFGDRMSNLIHWGMIQCHMSFLME